MAMLFNTAAMQVSAAEDSQVNNNSLVVGEDTDIATPYATSMYVGHVQFTGTYTGSWRSVPGSHVRMCIAVKAVDSIDYSFDFTVGMQQYPNVGVGTMNFIQGISKWYVNNYDTKEMT